MSKQNNAPAGENENIESAQAPAMDFLAGITQLVQERASEEIESIFESKQTAIARIRGFAATASDTQLKFEMELGVKDSAGVVHFAQGVVHFNIGDEQCLNMRINDIVIGGQYEVEIGKYSNAWMEKKRQQIEAARQESAVQRGVTLEKSDVNMYAFVLLSIKKEGVAIKPAMILAKVAEKTSIYAQRTTRNRARIE